jgi:hypothetical protein
MVRVRHRVYRDQSKEVRGNRAAGSGRSVSSSARQHESVRLKTQAPTDKEKTHLGWRSVVSGRRTAIKVRLSPLVTRGRPSASIEKSGSRRTPPVMRRSTTASSVRSTRQRRRSSAVHGFRMVVCCIRGSGRARLLRGRWKDKVSIAPRRKRRAARVEVRWHGICGAVVRRSASARSAAGSVVSAWRWRPASVISAIRRPVAIASINSAIRRPITSAASVRWSSVIAPVSGASLPSVVLSASSAAS